MLNKFISYSFFTKFSLLLVIFALHNCTNQKASFPPNILLIQADDLGYDDLSLHGNPLVETPNLNQLGLKSVQFDNFYLQSVCAPSRAALLTGRNFLKTGVTSVHAGRDYLNLQETLIGEIFQAAGYKTGMWGKWHNGKTNGYFPWDRGFDEAYYSCLYNYFDNIGLMNGNEVPTKGFTTDALTDMAISFIQKNKDKPFLAYVSHLAPHNPWRAPQKYIDKYLAKGLSKPASNLYGMIDNLDENIGRLIQTLEDENLTENTIIVFLSDNGPWIRSYRFGLTDEEWKKRNPSKLRGRKGTNWENGIKSPLFIKFGNQLPRKHVNRLTKIEDLFPTLAAMCKVPIPDSLNIDGIDFSPIFENKKVPDSKLFFASHNPQINIGKTEEDKNWAKPNEPLTNKFKENINFENQGLAIRDGDWKFIQNQKHGEKELYNLKTDPKESSNQILEKPRVVDSLQQELKNWYTEILAENSYNMPTFQIGYHGRIFNQIYALAPSHISKNLQNKSHFLQNWTAIGDHAKYNIKVHLKGNYKVSLIHEIENFNDYEFALKTSYHSTPTSALVDSQRKDFGTLLKGESAYWDDFDLKSTFRKSIIISEMGVLKLRGDENYLQLELVNISKKPDHHPENTKVISIQLTKIEE